VEDEADSQTHGAGGAVGARLKRATGNMRRAAMGLRGVLDRRAADIRPLASATAARMAQVARRGTVAGHSAIHLSRLELTAAWARTQRGWHHGWRRPFAALLGRHARGLLILNLLVAVVVSSLLPPAFALANALQDYRELRALGESAVLHLLAAKADIERLASAGASLIQTQTAPQSDQTQSAAPYTVLVQRQAGTFYPFQATIHPSPQLAEQGFTALTVATVVGADTPLPLDRTLSGPPTPPRRPVGSPTPAPTAAPSTGSTGSNGAGDAGSQLDPALLEVARAELKGAQRDFQQLRMRLDNPDWVLATAGAIPQADKQLAAARVLVETGYDLATMGLELSIAAQPVLTRLHGVSLLGGRALLTSADLETLQHALARATQELASISARIGSLEVNQLPISAAQKASFAQLQGQLPRMEDALQQLPLWLAAVGWLLGVGQPRHFLVQTLDRAELRPSGGFTGDYGVLTVHDGNVEPFALNNVNDIDFGYRSNGWTYGRRPPAEYAWWPFGNWGLRDSNLSADFPTAARINIQLFHNEGGGDVDGVIHITPVAIEHVLRITGPILIADYHETITADNLEDKLHYYQLDPAGIAKQQQLNPGDTTHSLRKRFTQLLGQLLQDKVRHLPTSQLVQVARVLFADLRARDVQLYATDPQVEELLARFHATGAVDTTPGLDGYMLVQANVSAAKSSPYVQITQRDDITLDDHGGATHRFVIQLFNNNRGVNVYGFQAYRDYVRIYVPPGAQLSSASGFDTGQPLCWAPLQWQPRPKPARFATVPDCPANPYPHGEMVCMPGFYGPGPEAPSGLLGTDGRTPWVLDRRGPPTATTSDLPGRAMWGGYVNISPGCTATAQLSWHVPGVVHGA